MATQHPQRNDALRLLQQGARPTDVARQLDLNPATVRSWKARTLAAGDQNPFGNAQTPPYGQSPSPIDTMLGTTRPAPDPGKVRPVRFGQPPIGASGRANFYGLPQPDETNAQLMGPQGLRNFDLMYRTDPDIRRLVLMCWSPIVAGTWGLNAYGGDKATDQDREIAETIWWALTKFMRPNLFEHLNEVGPILLRSGFAPFEQIWAPHTYKGKELMLPRKLDVRLPRSIWRWFQDDYGEMTDIGQILPNKSDVIIPTSELVYYRLAAEGDNWVGTSLLRHCYKSWIMKDRLERIDAIGQERKAVGVPIVYTPENADDQTRQDVETILANLHTNEVGYIMMPGPYAADVGEMKGMQGWRVEVITFDSSSGDSIQASLKYHRDGIASAFLGDFMQLGHHQVGARATAQVQEDPFLTAVTALGTFVVPPLNKLITRITELNWPDANGAPDLDMTITNAASLTEISTYVQSLVSIGAMQADPELEDWLRARADLPPANPDYRNAREQAELAAIQIAAQQKTAKKYGLPVPGTAADDQSQNGAKQQGPEDIVQQATARSVAAKGVAVGAGIGQQQLDADDHALVRLLAADSMAKATSPEPFSESRTSNWVARVGGLPPYIQHIAHDVQEEGHSEEEAIAIAVATVKDPPAHWGAEAKAAAALAASEWEEKKARARAMGLLRHSD